jgi:hypothetical protein
MAQNKAVTVKLKVVKILAVHFFCQRKATKIIKAIATKEAIFVNKKTI